VNETIDEQLEQFEFEKKTQHKIRDNELEKLEYKYGKEQSDSSKDGDFYNFENCTYSEDNIKKII